MSYDRIESRKDLDHSQDSEDEDAAPRCEHPASQCEATDILLTWFRKRLETTQRQLENIKQDRDDADRELLKASAELATLKLRLRDYQGTLAVGTLVKDRMTGRKGIILEGRNDRGDQRVYSKYGNSHRLPAAVLAPVKTLRSMLPGLPSIPLRFLSGFVAGMFAAFTAALLGVVAPRMLQPDRQPVVEAPQGLLEDCALESDDPRAACLLCALDYPDHATHAEDWQPIGEPR